LNFQFLALTKHDVFLLRKPSDCYVGLKPALILIIIKTQKYTLLAKCGGRGSVVVKALGYEPEDRGFENPIR
jgi:hypothetical protein